MSAALKRLAFQMCRKRTLIGEGGFRSIKSDSAPILYDQWYEGCGINWEDVEPHCVNYCYRWLKAGVARSLIVQAFGVGIRQSGVTAKDMKQVFQSTGAITIAEVWLRKEIERKAKQPQKTRGIKNGIKNTA